MPYICDVPPSHHEYRVKSLRDVFGETTDWVQRLYSEFDAALGDYIEGSIDFLEDTSKSTGEELSNLWQDLSKVIESNPPPKVGNQVAETVVHRLKKAKEKLKDAIGPDVIKQAKESAEETDKLLGKLKNRLEEI